MATTLLQPNYFVGLDVGTRSHFTVMDTQGTILKHGSVTTTQEGLHRLTSEFPKASAVQEASTRSAWISRFLETLSWRVVTTDAASVAYELRARRQKSDKNDSRNLAELLRTNSSQLRPVEHRPATFQDDYALLRARRLLVRTRANLVNNLRGLSKAAGVTIPKCDTSAFARRARAVVTAELRPAAEGILKTISVLDVQIRDYDTKIEAASKKYVITSKLRDIPGVGPVTALAFVLVVFKHQRFARASDIGPYLGLVPGKAQSGDRDPQCRITRRGNPMLRSLLVQSAHYLISRRPDCELKRWATAYLGGSRGKNARKRAVIAIARRLAARMLAIWKSGSVYDPFHGQLRTEQRLRSAC